MNNIKIWNFKNYCCTVNCEASIKLFVIFASRYECAAINCLHRPWDIYVRFPIAPLELFIDLILPAALWSWGRLSPQQTWVPWIFCGGKGGRYLGLTTLPNLCADCLEIRQPQPPTNIRACPGIALPSSDANSTVEWHGCRRAELSTTQRLIGCYSLFMHGKLSLFWGR